MKRNPLAIIFMTVFIDLVGFGMIIPLNPFLAREFGASPARVGWLMTIYSLMQFVASPYWGKVSDRIGRRPVILTCLLGIGVAHLGFAFAQSYFWLFVARLVAGLFGANIATAMAYIADVTEAKDRSKGMGLIGAAFGLGFLVGPFLGGLLSTVGTSLGDRPPFGPSFAAIFAAVLSLANFCFAWFYLIESLPTNHRSLVPRESRFQFFRRFFSRPTLGPLMAVYFLSSLAMAHMEASLFLFVQDRFAWNLMTASFGFAYIGVIMVLTQGVLIRKLLPLFGEARLLLIGQICSAIGFIGIAIAPSVSLLAIAVTFLGLGNGLATPSLSGSVSLLTKSDEQGRMLGINQGLAALGRIIGPVTGGYLYQMLGTGAPFLVAAGLISCGFLVSASVVKGIPNGHIQPST